MARMPQRITEGPCVFSDQIASTAKENPRNPLPASPIKIRAGAQFQNKKPSAAAAIASEAEAPADCPVAQGGGAPPGPPVTASTPAIPSIPSMKLKRFTAQTIPIRARSDPARPNVTTKSPSRIAGEPPPQHAAQLPPH